MRRPLGSEYTIPSASTAETPQMQTQSRRTFYIAVINLFGGMMAAALALPAAMYLLLKPKGGSTGDWTEVADLSSLKVGAPQEVVYHRKRMDGWKKTDEKTTTWLVRTNDSTVVAYTPSCPHLGCAYHWEDKDKVFLCPCHTSVFSMDGKVISGPAPRPLDRYEAKVENGQVLIGAQTQV